MLECKEYYTHSHVNIIIPSSDIFIRQAVYETTSLCVISTQQTQQADINRQQCLQTQLAIIYWLTYNYCDYNVLF
jgi:hypothetical protein